MTSVLRFAAPRVVEIVDLATPNLRPGELRVRTVYSGISAGTELTAYRGTNPYLTGDWDPEVRLFRASDLAKPAAYPLDGWGYSEVGEVVEVAASPDEPSVPGTPTVGDMVWGIWGHRSEAVVTTQRLIGHVLPGDLDPLAASFVRVGAIALNAVLAADLGVGSTVVIVGQGVIGLLATRLAVLNGAQVVAVDGIASRRDWAATWGGAQHVLEPGPELALQVRDITGGTGADVAIELSGSYPGLHEAIRSVGADGTVVASGFYQGAATAVHLGEEFHHNRVQVLASQIGSPPVRLRARWDVPRLQRTLLDVMRGGRVDPIPLVTHRFPLASAADAYTMLDNDPAAALQVILEFK